MASGKTAPVKSTSVRLAFEKFTAQSGPASSLLEELLDDRRLCLGDVQGLYAELLLNLPGGEFSGLPGEVRVHDVAEPARHLIANLGQIIDLEIELPRIRAEISQSDVHEGYVRVPDVQAALALATLLRSSLISRA